MEIPEVPKAEEYLRRIGYYRLSAYWHPFRTVQQDASGTAFLSHQFKQGTTFKHVTDLYAFDKALRLLALDAIERIEISVRTEIALAIGQHDPWAHRDNSRLDGNFTRIRPPHTSSKFDNWLDRLDEKAANSKEEFAEHFRIKYPNNHLPIWVAVELLDFGPLSHFLSGMRYSDLQTISASYGGIRPHLLKSWIRCLSGIRNVCAHHARLWNKPLIDQPVLPRVGEIADLDHLWSAPEGNRRIYAAFALMQALLREVNPRTKWADRLKSHIDTFPTAPNIQISNAGFPPGWKSMSLWN